MRSSDTSIVTVRGAIKHAEAIKGSMPSEHRGFSDDIMFSSSAKQSYRLRGGANQVTTDPFSSDPFTVVTPRKDCWTVLGETFSVDKSNPILFGWFDETSDVRTGLPTTHFWGGPVVVPATPRPPVSYPVWPTANAEVFRDLAETQPMFLLAWIVSGDLAPADLTFAAEVAGSISNSALVRHALVPLLEHESSLVREGAVYGLAEHLDKRVRSALSSRLAKEKSPGVRAAIEEALL